MISILSSSSLVLLLVVILSLISSSSSDTTTLLHLQGETAALASAHHNIRTFLQDKKIPIGAQPLSLRLNKDKKKDKNSIRVAISTEDNNLECRVSLGRAPIGSKCVAPCGCTGSQQWIQFSELNSLRRKEENQWKICQTCQQKFEYSGYTIHGGIKGNIVTTLLDNPKILRIGLLSIIFILCYNLAVDHILLRFSVSRIFWQKYPQWSRIVHLPLVLKFWGAKLLFQLFFDRYLSLEKFIALKLADLETALIEPNLPVNEDDDENNAVKDED